MLKKKNTLSRCGLSWSLSSYLCYFPKLFNGSNPVKLCCFQASFFSELRHTSESAGELFPRCLGFGNSESLVQSRLYFYYQHGKLKIEFFIKWDQRYREACPASVLPYETCVIVSAWKEVHSFDSKACWATYCANPKQTKTGKFSFRILSMIIRLKPLSSGEKHQYIFFTPTAFSGYRCVSRLSSQPISDSKWL